MAHSTVLPDGLDIRTTSEGVSFFVVPAHTHIFAHSIQMGEHPAWFSNAACACAFAIRRGTHDPPTVFTLKRDVILVDVMHPNELAKITDSLTEEIQKLAVDIDTMEQNIEADGSHRSLFKVKRYTSKRLGKLKSGVVIATGFGIDKKIQERILQTVYSDSELSLRKGFQTDQSTEESTITLGGVVYGNNESSLNRVSIPKYDHAFAMAIKHVFPWADGYVCGSTASTWHKDQLYPSELCLFTPANAIDVDSAFPLPSFDEIHTSITESTQIDPIGLPDIHTYMTRFNLEFRTKDQNNASMTMTGGAKNIIEISVDIESIVPCITLDNPLTNNVLDFSDVVYDLYNICPPAKKSRR